MSQARVLIVAAVAAGLLYGVGAIALGSPPDANESPAQVAAWFGEHHDGARIYAWTATLGTLAFAVLAGLVSEVVPRPFGTVFLLGAAAFVVETALQAWFWGGLALHPETLDPATARTVLDVTSYWGPILTGATTTMIGAVTALGLGGRALIPRWLLALGAIAFIEQALETVTVFGTQGFTAPGGDMNLLLGAGLTAAWFVGLVVWSARTLGSCRVAPAS